MSTSEIIEAVHAAGGTLELEHGRIKYRLPDHALYLIPILRKSKRELLSALKNSPQPLCEDPAPMQKHFDHWRSETCILDRRCASSVSLLHIGFSRWCTKQRITSCTRSAFERLLTALAQIENGLALGVVFRDDYEWVFGAGSRGAANQYARSEREPVGQAANESRSQF